MSIHYSPARRQFFDIIASNLQHLSEQGLRKLGVYPLKPTIITAADPLRTYEEGAIICNDFYCFREVVETTKTISELRATLAIEQHKILTDFSKFFQQLDAKRTRAIAAITEMAALKLESSVEDIERLSQLNMLAEDNRDILQAIQVLTIPDDADLETAQRIVQQVLDTKPWIPAGMEI